MSLKKTKEKTKLWLIGKSPPLDSLTDPERPGFCGKYPPTGENIILQFLGPSQND